MPRPHCAVCRRPVDMFRQFEYAAAGTGQKMWLFIAQCHGQNQQVTLTESDLLEMVPGTMELGPAFLNTRTKQPWGQT